MSSLLDELHIFFFDRALRGEGSVVFSVPPGAVDAVLDEGNVIFTAMRDGRWDQVCLRVLFNVVDETQARLYEFTMLSREVNRLPLMGLISEHVEVAGMGGSTWHARTEEGQNAAALWSRVTKGLLDHRGRQLDRRALMNGWERTGAYFDFDSTLHVVGDTLKA